jgi:hypothetical protein
VVLEEDLMLLEIDRNDDGKNNQQNAG